MQHTSIYPDLQNTTLLVTTKYEVMHEKLAQIRNIELLTPFHSQHLALQLYTDLLIWFYNMLTLHKT